MEEKCLQMINPAMECKREKEKESSELVEVTDSQNEDKEEERQRDKKKKEKRERAKERREKRRQDVSLLRTIPYSDHQRWWSADTIAVVTGANRGIGFEIARQLAMHGLTVILTSRDAAVGKEAAKVLQEEGLNVLVHQLDIVDLSSVKLFTEWLRQHYGGADILVNNAGVNFNVGEDNCVEFAEDVIRTNYFGTKNVIQAMIPLMRPSTLGARIVNVSSRLGRLNGRRNRIGDLTLRHHLEDVNSLSEEIIDRTLATFLAQVKDGSWTAGGWPQTYTDYSMSKLAVNAYTRLMAKMLSRRPEGQKIYINYYCPGWVKTAMTGWAGHTSPEEGADTGVWLALLPDQLVTGNFFAERREAGLCIFGGPMQALAAAFPPEEMANFRRALLGISRILDSTPSHGPTTAPNLSIRPHILYRPLVGSFSRSYSYNQPLDIDLSTEESKRRLFNRLLYRSKQRGYLELDLVLGKWVEENIHSMDENGVKSLFDVLELENPDLWKWLTGQEQPPEIISSNPVFSAVRDKVMNNLDSHAAPETRATPGKEWVRGWDDFKKGKDSPITGNQ
ncbi:hypothetical protein Vadar_022850 [Vaccinium darrowii]|uniref:Uncharacterized protein n=1 Tax=Vaccinium darrowii TaxID=229202 RepID=A0ACB7ZM88_9ERIC|nr:hypothetical protein Vadar_022850 [Vaccinium darrowii]